MGFCILLNVRRSPLAIKRDEVLQSESLHIVIVNHVKAKIEQSLIVLNCVLEQRAYVELQFVEHWLIYKAIAVYQTIKQRVFTYCLQMFVTFSILLVPEALAWILYMAIRFLVIITKLNKTDDMTKTICFFICLMHDIT